MFGCNYCDTSMPHNAMHSSSNHTETARNYERVFETYTLKKSDLHIFKPLCVCDYISYLLICTQHPHHMCYTTGAQQE